MVTSEISSKGDYRIESVHKELFKKGKEFFSSLKILDVTDSGDNNLAKDIIWMGTNHRSGLTGNL